MSRVSGNAKREIPLGDFPDFLYNGGKKDGEENEAELDAVDDRYFGEY